MERDGAWLLFEANPLHLAEVPSEVATREFRDTDPRDIDALAELCSLGMIYRVDWDDAAGDFPSRGVHRLAMDATSEAYGLSRVPDDIDEERRELYRRDKPLHRFPIHVAEVAYRVVHVQSCAEHVLAYLSDQPVHEVWPGCTDDIDAWRRFSGIIERPLRDFPIHVRIQSGPEPSPADIGATRATLYSVAMLQLVNDLAEEVEYLKCHNESCGRLFYRQRGRSEYGGHRTRGVRYCSSACARSQYQRERRRREKAERNGVAR